MDINEMTVERVSGNEQGDPQVDAAPINVDVVVSRQVPTLEYEVRNSVGKVIRVLRKVDKAAIFALPANDLRPRAAILTVKPSGRVLVQDRAGALLARFADRDQAVKHLKAAGVDASKLAGGRVPTREKEAAAAAAKARK